MMYSSPVSNHDRCVTKSLFFRGAGHLTETDQADKDNANDPEHWSKAKRETNLNGAWAEILMTSCN